MNHGSEVIFNYIFTFLLKVNMKKQILSLFAALALCYGNAYSQNEFNIRGLLPWHNFLSGPTSWNLDDYEKYLDRCKEENINFIGFHNYTGGGERYATYVEPMIKIEYKHIIPQAYFDNSLTARWGYLPMHVKDYAYSTDTIFSLPNGAVAFGCDASITSNTTAEHYEKAQTLMQNVLKMAHRRGISMAMGFEFGVIPPEYFSLNTGGNCFYWPGESNMIPNPTKQYAKEIHYATLDNILKTYPGIDYIWMWLNEHSFMGVNMDKALQDSIFLQKFNENQYYFSEAVDPSAKFIGVWALEYMKMTYEYLKLKGVKAKIILGGWGGGHQLPLLLKGLDRALPKDIIFSCLNPDLGKTPQPAFLADIAKNRKVWAIPWLEGDHQLWHFQPRVKMMRDHVKLAAEQKLDGVVAIHWRTEEPRYNLKTFAYFASNKKDEISVEQLYKSYLTEEFGEKAAKAITPLLVRMDIEQIQWNVPSPEFYAFTPEWGRLDQANIKLRKDIVAEASSCLNAVNGVQCKNLKRFIAMFQFELLLDEVNKAMESAYIMKKQEYELNKTSTYQEYQKSYQQLMRAPIKNMFKTYVQRINSRGELGVLSSLNQRVWREFNDLKNYLEEKLKN